MSSCSVMRGLALNLAMSCHNIGGNGPPPRDSNQIPLPNTQPVQSVRRKLFGDVDHQQTSRDLERELQQCEERDKIKYNFDFKSEQPLNLPDSRYEWSQLNDPEVDKTLSQQQLSTKLCKKSDEVIANTSQSPSVSSPSNTSSFNVSPSLVLVSRPTSATISLDSQSLASSSSAETISTIGSDVNQTESRVKTTKQSTITAFFDGRKSAKSERKRSGAALNVSHKGRQSKRQLRECTSAVKREDTDTTDAEDTASDDEDSVQTSTGTAV
jgi:hypothetical protein